MAIRNNLQVASYIKKMMFGETANILPFTARVQKPINEAAEPAFLLRCTPDEVNIPCAFLDEFYRKIAQSNRLNAHHVYVLRHGSVAAEGHFAPYSAQYWHVTHSLCKSFTGTAIGMLLEDGLLSLDERICDIFPEKCNLLTGKRTKMLTIHHLLSMRSGVNFRETGVVISSDWVGSFLSSDILFEPGTQFNYNSMNSFVLSAIVTRKTGLTLFDFLKSRLFEPLGFGNIAWETDPENRYNKGGWGMYILPEDLLKFGLLYLQKGVWNQGGEDVQILSENWVNMATTSYSTNSNGEEYGYQIWTHEADGSYMFNGMFGQYVSINPALDMVVLVNAGSGNVFINGPTHVILSEFYKQIAQNDARSISCISTSEDCEALEFTLQNLRFEQCVPVRVPEPILTWWQKLLALFTQKPLPCAAPTLPEACFELSKKEYEFPANKITLAPIVVAEMCDFYTTGLTNLLFCVEDNIFSMCWTEGDETHVLPIGFDHAEISELNFGGNYFAVGTTGTLTKDEDDTPVLKLTLSFLEHSSAQHVKIFFEPESVTVKLIESPSVLFVMSHVESTSQNSSLMPGIGALKDANYFGYLLNRFCLPVITGKEIKPT